MKKNVLISLSVVVLLAVAAGSFYGGTLFEKSQRSKTGFGNFGAGNFQTARNGSGAGAGAGGFVTGEITAKDANSITVKLPNNKGTKIVFFSSQTQITKSASGAAEDLATGANISVNGTADSNGTVTAKSIQIMPQMQQPPANNVNQ